jgi:hypothetical protein
MKRALLAVSCLLFVHAAAASPIITFNDATGGSGTNLNESVGWQFDVVNTITVYELGWYDQNQDGLSVLHTVGIWDSGGTLLTSVTVPGGTIASLDGIYRMMPVTPVTLAPGAYTIGGSNFVTSTDRLVENVIQSVDPRITYVDGVYGVLNMGFLQPTNVDPANTGLYGPMFGVATPEPGSLLMIIGGFVVLVWGRGRRKK